MQDQDSDTTIGTGGWTLVAVAGVVCFVVLRFLFQYDVFPAIVFALAIALVVLLVLYRLALAVTRYEDADAARQVRRIVPASSVGEGATRVSGIEGAQASPVAAVPVRPDPVTPMPVRPSSVVTPLSRVESAPILPPKPVAPPPKPPAPPVAAAAVAETPKPAPKPKAEPKPKADGAAKAEFKSKAQLTAEAVAPATAKAKPKAAPAPKVAAKAAAPATPKAAPAAKAAPVAKSAPAAKAPAAKAPAAKAAAKPKAAKPKAAPVGLVRLTAPRGGKADDLKLIDGVGPALEKLVNSLGFYHFDQIAAWTEADVALVDAEMKSFKGRATRDKWVVQAKILATGGTVEQAAAAAKA